MSEELISKTNDISTDFYLSMLVFSGCKTTNSFITQTEWACFHSCSTTTKAFVTEVAETSGHGISFVPS